MNTTTQYYENESQHDVGIKHSDEHSAEKHKEENKESVVRESLV